MYIQAYLHLGIPWSGSLFFHVAVEMHIASDDLMCAVVSVSQVAMDLLHLHIDRWYPQ